MIHQIEFAGPLPLISQVVREISDTTGLLLSYKDRGEGGVVWKLSTSWKTMHIVVIPNEQAHLGEYYYWLTSDPLHKLSHYMHWSTAWVLVQLGGKSDEPLPEWAGKPWLAVRKNWNSSYWQLV